MKVEFDATLDDFVDVNMRIRKRSHVLRSFNWKVTMVVALTLGFMEFMRGDGPLWWNALAGCRGAVIAGGVFFALLTVLQPIDKWRIRRFYREQFATDGPIQVEVEISESGVSVRQHGAQITYEWKSIKSVDDRVDSIELWKPGGPVVVRNRAFDSAEMRYEFIGLCRSFTKTS